MCKFLHVQQKRRASRIAPQRPSYLFRGTKNDGNRRQHIRYIPLPLNAPLRPYRQKRPSPIRFAIISCEEYNIFKYSCGINGTYPRAKPAKAVRVKIIEEEMK